MGLTPICSPGFQVFSVGNQRFGLLLVLGLGALSEEARSLSPKRTAGNGPLRRFLLSRLIGELAELPIAGTLPLLLAGLEVRLTGETRLRLRLERLGNDPEAGGDEAAVGDCPAAG